MIKNYYDILEVSKQASLLEIKSSFKRLAKKYHPDLNRTDKDCEEIFKNILIAYEILSNEEYRKYYDDEFNGLYTRKYENNNLLEPKYTNIKEVINILQNLKVQLKKLHPAHINVNNLYTILNHILNPEIIYQQINSIDNQAKIDFINLILYVYHYLPSYIIEKLSVKMYVITLYSKDYVKITNKIIRKKKRREFVSNFIDNSGPLFTLIILFIIILVGSFISWFISLF